MNETTAASVPGASLIPDGTSVITTMHFAIIAVLAVLTLLAILYGMRLKRRRRVAERTVEAHHAEAEASVVPNEPFTPVEPPKAHFKTPAVETPVVDIPAVEVPPAIAAGAETRPVAPTTAHAGAPVTMLKGLGPKVAARLGELGVTTVGHLSALDDDAAARLDTQLGAFAGRMARDRWLEQARFLAAGDRAGFEAVFGKL